MADILIRGVPDSTIEQINRQAQDLGVSRSEFLRRWLNRDFQPAAPVSTSDLDRYFELIAEVTGQPVERLRH